MSTLMYGIGVRGCLGLLRDYEHRLQTLIQTNNNTNNNNTTDNTNNNNNNNTLEQPDWLLYELTQLIHYNSRLQRKLERYQRGEPQLDSIDDSIDNTISMENINYNQQSPYEIVTKDANKKLKKAQAAAIEPEILTIEHSPTHYSPINQPTSIAAAAAALSLTESNQSETESQQSNNNNTNHSLDLISFQSSEDLYARATVAALQSNPIQQQQQQPRIPQLSLLSRKTRNKSRHNNNNSLIIDSAQVSTAVLQTATQNLQSNPEFVFAAKVIEEVDAVIKARRMSNTTNSNNNNNSSTGISNINRRNSITRIGSESKLKLSSNSSNNNSNNNTIQSPILAAVINPKQSRIPIAAVKSNYYHNSNESLSNTVNSTNSSQSSSAAISAARARILVHKQKQRLKTQLSDPNNFNNSINQELAGLNNNDLYARLNALQSKVMGRNNNNSNNNSNHSQSTPNLLANINNNNNDLLQSRAKFIPRSKPAEQQQQQQQQSNQYSDNNPNDLDDAKLRALARIRQHREADWQIIKRAAQQQHQQLAPINRNTQLQQPQQYNDDYSLSTQSQSQSQPFKLTLSPATRNGHKRAETQVLNLLSSTVAPSKLPQLNTSNNANNNTNKQSQIPSPRQLAALNLTNNNRITKPSLIPKPAATSSPSKLRPMKSIVNNNNTIDNESESKLSNSTNSNTDDTIAAGRRLAAELRLAEELMFQSATGNNDNGNTEDNDNNRQQPRLIV